MASLRPAPGNKAALAKLLKIGKQIKGKSFITIQGIVSKLAEEARLTKVFTNVTSNLVNSIQGETLKKGQTKTVSIKMARPADKPQGHPGNVTIKAENDVTGVFFAGMEYAVHVENRENKDVLTGTWERNKQQITKILGKGMKLSRLGI